MENKRLLQKVNLREENPRVRPILVNHDHPLLEVYGDLKDFFSGNIRLANPQVSNEKNWSEADQIEYYSPVEGSVEKISKIEFENKVKPLFNKLFDSFKKYSFDESDPDQYEKKALLNSFKLPSDDLSEYVVKVGSYYVLCNWGLENAPKLGELPPPPPRIEKEGELESEQEDETTSTKDEDSKLEESDTTFGGEIGDDDYEQEEDELNGEDPIVISNDEDENEVIAWLREHWWKILLGVLIFILLLLLVRNCGNGGLASNGNGPTSPAEPGHPEIVDEPSQNGLTENGLEEGVPERDDDEYNEPDYGVEPFVRPSPPSAESPPIINERPDDLLDNEQSYREGIPTDQWEEIGMIFQMETEEGYWYWLRLRNGDTYLIDFIPKEDQTNTSDDRGNYFNTI